MKISNKKMLAGWIAGAFFIAFTSVGFAGTLEPPESAIDSGTGEPKPTMKTLDQIPGSWDRLLLANDGLDSCHSSRFTCVMNDLAVRDNETGLVWERSPLTSTHEWSPAKIQCMARTTGDRKGWRLPSVHELNGLVNPNNIDPNNIDPSLPVGHPFNDVQASSYWSATLHGGNSSVAWGVSFFMADVFGIVQEGFLRVWCVRGAMNADVY